MVDIRNKDIITRYYKKPIVYRIPFPYTTISQFAKAFKDYIHFQVYNNFHGIVYADYNKGLQTVIQMMETGNDGDIIDYGLPLFNYDIQIDGPVKEVDSYWRTTSLFVKQAKRIYDPFYKDDELELRLVYRRMHGTITSTIYCSAQPEELDIQMAFTDAFQGMNRWVVTPIRTFTIIPNEFVADRVDGVQISKAIDPNHITKKFINAVNKKSYYIESNSAPHIRLTSISPTNSLYGGTGLPQFTLNANFEFEIEVPQYVLANAVNYGNLKLDMNLAFEYENDNRIILNKIFGDIIYNQSNENYTTCSNGIVLGTNAIVIENDNTSTIDFDTVYPQPRSFIPTENDLVIYLDTPIGVLASGAEFFHINENKQTNKYNIVLDNSITFQKDDFIGVYIFRPNVDDNSFTL